MLKPVFNEQIILATLLKDEKKRVKILGEVSEVNHFFITPLGRDIFEVVKKLHYAKNSITLDTVCSQLTGEGNFGALQNIVTGYEAADIKDIDLHLKTMKKNVLEKDLKDRVSGNILTSLSSDIDTESKVQYLEEMTASLKGRLEDNGASFQHVEELASSYKKALHDRETQQCFFQTGDPRLDKLMTYGFAPSEITFISGGTSNGKSHFASYLADGLASQGIPTSVYNFEMKNISTMDRIISIRGALQMYDLTKGYKELGEKGRTAIDYAIEDVKSNLKLSMYDDRPLSMEECFSEIEKLQAYYDTEYLVVFWDLFTKITDFAECNSPFDIEKLCNKFQAWTRKLKIHSVLLAQQNRELTKVILKDETDIYKIYPTIETTKNSGAFGEIADNFLLVCRPSLYANRYDWGAHIPQYMRVELAKQRGGITSGFDDVMLYRMSPGCLRLEAPADPKWNPFLEATVSDMNKAGY